MKKLLVPILTLGLVLGLGALALGAQASGSQTLTADVQSAFSVTIPDSVTLEVGPKTTDSTTETLDYSYNDTAANSITVDVSGTDADFHTMALTVSASNMTGSGSGKSLSVGSSSTTGATLISGLSDTADSYSADVILEGGKTDWSESAGTYSGALTLTYKMVS